MLSALAGWFPAFAFTQLMEMPIYRRASGRWDVAFLASAITHPIVWFVFPVLLDHGLGYWPMVALAETFAVGAEALWLHSMKVKQPLAWSALANACSFGLGIVLRELTGWV